MSSDKSADPLAFIPVEVRYKLDLISELDRRSAEQQIIWLIETYWSGRLEDTGKTPANPRSNLLRPEFSPDGMRRVRATAFQPSAPRPAPPVDGASK